MLVPRFMLGAMLAMLVLAFPLAQDSAQAADAVCKTQGTAGATCTVTSWCVDALLADEDLRAQPLVECRCEVVGWWLFAQVGKMSDTERAFCFGTGA